MPGVTEISQLKNGLTCYLSMFSISPPLKCQISSLVKQRNIQAFNKTRIS